MAQVVGQARDLDEVGVAAEGLAQLPPDLRALERVREPGARAVLSVAVAPAELDHLGLGRQPAQTGAVQDAGAVALEGRSLAPFRRLGRPALPVVLGVT